MTEHGKTTTPKGYMVFHSDHIGPEHLVDVDRALEDWDGESLITTIVKISADAPRLLSELYGPKCGDEPVLDDDTRVRFEARNGRPTVSKVIEGPGIAPRAVDTMVVIAGPSEQYGPCVYTAYGSHVVAPREVSDTYLTCPVEREAAELFWSEHALIVTSP